MFPSLPLPPAGTYPLVPSVPPLLVSYSNRQERRGVSEGTVLTE